MGEGSAFQGVRRQEYAAWMQQQSGSPRHAGLVVQLPRMTEAVQELSQRKGTDTRERILDVAEAAVLEKGFAATSIDELIAAVSITKSGFFYHFRDKGELARTLLARYIERENDLVDIPQSEVVVGRTPTPPPGYEVARIDVVVRLRRTR